jgi:hypothetical protein
MLVARAIQNIGMSMFPLHLVSGGEINSREKTYRSVKE